MYGIASEKKKAKTARKPAAKLQLRGKTLKAIKKKAAAYTSTKAKLGKKKAEKEQSKSPRTKGEKDVTTRATRRNVAAKKPTVTKADTGATVKKKIGSGKFLSPAKIREMVNAAGAPCGFEEK